MLIAGTFISIRPDSLTDILYEDHLSSCVHLTDGKTYLRDLLSPYLCAGKRQKRINALFKDQTAISSVCLSVNMILNTTTDL